jgi:hypothetical protein
MTKYFLRRIMQLKKIAVVSIITAIIGSSLSAQIRGSIGLEGEYDSNAYNDSYGGGSIVGKAYLDLTTDINLKLGGMFLGADYFGGYSAYLSYLGINQNDHLVKTLLWRSVGKDGFAGIGASYGFQLNAADRSSYDTNSLKIIGEAKIYPAQPVLLKIDGAVGSYQYNNLPKYDFDQMVINGSANIFLPSRTGLALLTGYKKYDFSPQPVDSQVPSNITNINPGIRISQGVGNAAGLSVEYNYLQNKVTTTDSYYMPDTLLNEVNEYFDYTGNKLAAKMTIRLNGGGKLILWGDYTTRDYSLLKAYSLPASDTSSILTRQEMEIHRADKESVAGLDYTSPLPESGGKINLNTGLYYDNNSSNDELYNYSKLILYAGVVYNF